MNSEKATTRRARTKIVATVGPACDSPEGIEALIQEGVNVFRLNTAHGNMSQHEAIVQRIRDVSEQMERTVAILMDLGGPKIRLGTLAADPTECKAGERLRFVRGSVSSSADILTSSYPLLIDELTVGDRVMLADGTVTLDVVEVGGDEVICEVVVGGVIRSRQGINLPGAKLSVAALTDRDREFAIWAADNDIDFVSLSFVQSDDDIVELRDLLQKRGSTAMIVAKIERREALDNLDNIVSTADAVMVARGDLGVEIDIAETAVVQKKIVGVCKKYCRPVIIATQMLDSMQHSNRPTRAEVSDVANAILDGADACMLSGETAIGSYPRETVAMMKRIMLSTEATLLDSEPEPPATAANAGVTPVTSAVVYGAARIASQLYAKLVVIATNTGGTARVKAKQRDFIPTVGVSEYDATLRKMCLFWGITPVTGAPVKDGPRLREFIDEWGRGNGGLSTGDRVVFVSGRDLLKHVHNAVVVHDVE